MEGCGLLSTGPGSVMCAEYRD